MKNFKELNYLIPKQQQQIRATTDTSDKIKGIGNSVFHTTRWGVEGSYEIYLIDKLNEFNCECRANENELKALDLVRHGQLNQLRQLFSSHENHLKPIRVDVILESTTSLLQQAILLEHQEIIEYLIRKGASLYQLDVFGRNSLQYALLTNKSENIINLLAKYSLENQTKEL